MALKNLDTLTAEINEAVRPQGGEPKVSGPALNALLRSLAAELTSLPEATPNSPAEALPRPVRVRETFGASAPITFDQDTDFELPDGSPLTEGFDEAGSAGAFSFAGAVRGTTVRVPYYAGTPFRLPASFNLLTGPLPTDNVKTILYFRYVRDNVVDVTAGTSQPGTYLARFWAMPGAADVFIALYMGRDTQVLAVSSEGRKVRSGAFNGGGPGVHFDATSGPRYVELFTYAGSPGLPALAGTFGGIGPVYGELNLDVLPELGGFCNLQFSRGYTKVIAHKPGMDLLIAYRYEGTLLDLSQCVVSTINAGSSYCSSVALPPANEHLTSLSLGEHRLYHQALTFPSLPNLRYLDLSIGQAYVSRLDTVDISQLPSLGEIYTQQASLRTLVIGANALARLTTAYFYQGRLTSRPEPFGQGHFATVVQLAERAHQLTNFDLGFNGLSEAEIDQLATALVAALPAAVAGPKRLNLADYPGTTAFSFGDNGYPHPFNHDPYFGYAYNAPVVSTATLGKLAQLQAGGWQVTYNEFIPLYLTYLSPTTFRGTYQGPAAIDRWAVGDVLPLQSADGRYVPSATYRVVGGSGQTWELAVLDGQPPLAAFGDGLWGAVRPAVSFASLPLRTLAYDDSDAFATFEGTWEAYQGPDWPGGCSNNHLMQNRVLPPEAPLTQCTTAAFAVAGTPEEGIEVYGCGEGDAPVQASLQALDGPDTDWHPLTQFTDNAYVLALRAGHSPLDPASYDVYYSAGGTQTYYSRLQTTVMYTLWGLPAGRYRLRLTKLPNAASATESGNNRLTVIDGFRVHTRQP